MVSPGWFGIFRIAPHDPWYSDKEHADNPKGAERGLKAVSFGLFGIAIACNAATHGNFLTSHVSWASMSAKPTLL
jgi:hypothetical protein